MAAGRISEVARGKRPVKVTIVKKPRRKKKGPKITKIMAQKMTIDLDYVDVVSIDAGSASIASHVFNAAGIFDPDETSTGHQPLGRDQYSAFFNKYRVLSSSIKVTPVVDAAANVVPALYGVFRDNDATLNFALGTHIIEDPRNTGGWGMHVGLASGVGHNGNAKLNQVRTNFNAKRDLAPEGLNDATIVGANPSGAVTTTFYQVWASSILGNNPGSLDFLVEIKYRVEYTDPIFLAQS